MNKLKQNIEELGLTNGLLYTLNRAIFTITKQTLIYKYYFYTQPVSSKELIPNRLRKKYTIKEVKQGNEILEHFNRPQAIINSRYEQGAICFSALKNDELVGFIWLITTPYTEDEVRCIFHPTPEKTNAWDFDVYVCPKDRLGITFALLWQQANTWLSKKGYQWTSSRVSAFNIQSIRSHERLGAIRVSSGTFLKLGATEFAFFSKKPYFYVSIKPNRVPVYEIHASSQYDRTIP